MKTYPVKFLHNSMQGASQTTDATAGDMIAILTACLVDGFGALIPASMVFDSDTGWAKATISLGHAYDVDSIIDVSGSSIADYNGEHRVMQVTNTDVWFELEDGLTPVDSTGTAVIKIAPLGWELSHSNPEKTVCIFKPAGELGNVSLRVDNTEFDGWFYDIQHASLMKVAMVENVVDVDNYDTIYEHRWPAGSTYSDRKWDLVGDSRIMFFLPEYGSGKEQSGFCAGYIDSIRAGDNYHFIMNALRNTVANHSDNYWSQNSISYNYYTSFAKNSDSGYQVMARPYTQLEGTTAWFKRGLGNYGSDCIAMPNPVDNGFYINAEPAMIMETGNYLRGYMPMLVAPLADHSSYYRKNLQNLPEFPNKIFRMLRSTYEERSDYDGVLIGFDISTVEV